MDKVDEWLKTNGLEWRVKMADASRLQSWSSGKFFVHHAAWVTPGYAEPDTRPETAMTVGDPGLPNETVGESACSHAFARTGQTERGVREQFLLEMRKITQAVEESGLEQGLADIFNMPCRMVGGNVAMTMASGARLSLPLSLLRPSPPVRDLEF
jgi:hypothetical protein